jgi:hypothetical protein
MSTLIKVAIIAGIVTVVVAALPDIKRYVKISRMLGRRGPG